MTKTLYVLMEVALHFRGDPRTPEEIARLVREVLVKEFHPEYDGDVDVELELSSP